MHLLTISRWVWIASLLYGLLSVTCGFLVSTPLNTVLPICTGRYMFLILIRYVYACSSEVFPLILGYV